MTPTLLLADDSLTIQRVIELTFADEDLNVVAVSDGEEAIAVLERTPPDIVLADVGMPGRTGYEVAQHIKDTPRLAHIPVVLLTGAFEPVDQAKAAAAGCAGVLAKPFEPQMVIGRVKELLSKPNSASMVGPLAPPSATAPGSPIPDLDSSYGDGIAESGDYFERLDQAFANLSAIDESGVLPLPGATALDWFATPQPADAPAAVPVDPPAPPVFDDAPTRPVSPPAFPPLAEAFAALLAAEQAAPPSTAVPLWPSPPAATTAVDFSDEAIEKIVSRVLDRLADRGVRESLAEQVSSIAERLVREEIERIKSSLK